MHPDIDHGLDAIRKFSLLFYQAGHCLISPRWPQIIHQAEVLTSRSLNPAENGDEAPSEAMQTVIPLEPFEARGDWKHRSKSHSTTLLTIF